MERISEYGYLITLWGMLFAVLIISTITALEVGVDRRDVNRDGEVNIVDLSVLATEIQEAR